MSHVILIMPLFVTVLPAIHTFIHKMKWATPSYTSQPQRFTAPLAGTHFPSRWGQEAELAWWIPLLEFWVRRWMLALWCGKDVTTGDDLTTRVVVVTKHRHNRRLENWHISGRHEWATEHWQTRLDHLTRDPHRPRLVCVCVRWDTDLVNVYQ